MGSSTPPTIALGSSGSSCDALGHESSGNVSGTGSCQESICVQGTAMATVEGSGWLSREGWGDEGGRDVDKEDGQAKTKTQHLRVLRFERPVFIVSNLAILPSSPLE